MPSSVTLKALGLNFSPNQISTPDGSLSEANNVIIRRDSVVESRRGFKLYGDVFGTSTDRAKQLMQYKNRILRHFSDTIQFDNGSGTFTSFSGNFSETQPGLRIKSIEANGNFYFTTSDGIKKISASSPSQFSDESGYITDAGGIKALDFTVSLNVLLGSLSGWFPQDSAVAYRVVWGTKDANNNLVLGSPSSRVEIINSLQNLIIRDFLNLLGGLDNLDQSGSLINDGDYLNSYKLSLNALADEIKGNIIALASQLDDNILYTQGGIATASAQVVTTSSVTIVFNSDVSSFIKATDYIQVSGFTSVGLTQLNNRQYVVDTVSTTTITATVQGTPALSIQGSTVDTNGVVKSYNYENIVATGDSVFTTSLTDLIISIPATDDQLLVIQNTLSRIINQLKMELSGVIPTLLKTTYIDPLDITTTATTNLKVLIPKGITSSYFFQVYRSAIAYALGAVNINTIVPSDELQLVYEAFPSSSDLANGFVSFEDVTPDAFRGANLYTNESSGEGILQSNDIPPFATDINSFKGFTFFANTRTRNRLSLDLIGVQKMIDDYNLSISPKISINSSTGSNTYEFVVGVGGSFKITCPAEASVPASGYFTFDTPDKSFYAWYDTTGSDPDPALADKTGIKILLSGLPIVTGTEVAERTRDVIAEVVDFFATSSSGAITSISNIAPGKVSAPTLGPGMSVAGFSLSSIVAGQGELTNFAQNTITFGAVASGAYSGTYFTFNFTNNEELFYLWYTFNGSGSDPAITGKTGYQVNLVTGDSTSVIAQKSAAVINNNISDFFNSSSLGATLTINNNTLGPCQSAANGGVPVPSAIFANPIIGAAQVLLSSSVSPSQAVDATARSLIRVINKNYGDNTYAYYLSGSGDVPGKISLESQSLEDMTFYLLANNANTGSSFSPDISPEFNITGISSGAYSTITINNHGLINGDQIVILNSNSLPSVDGVWEISSVTTNTFVIKKEVITPGTSGVAIKSTDAIQSSDETRQNRIYYSKIQQPEAVPILNFFEVGSSDSPILRIFPLRDSLFVFKEEGLYRISGQQAPFQVSLFDSSCKLTASDTVSVANNLIYGWTRQGISTVTESGVTTITRPIDTEIQKISSNNYSNFPTLSWGIGYESDNSYIVFTNKETTDTVATIAYRYSNLTNTWTTFDKTATCGINNFFDDMLYFGAGDVNKIEQERKTFTRLDYADREISSSIFAGGLFQSGKVIKFSSLTGINVGDVITQDQTLTIYHFNLLLNKLDLDPTIAIAPITTITTGLTPLITTSLPHNLAVGDTVRIINSNSTPSIDGNWVVKTTPTSTTFTISVTSAVTVSGSTGKARLNYTTSLSAISGDNMRNKIVQLATKLDSDPGCTLGTYLSSIQTYSGTITSNTANNPTLITTSSSHNLFSGRLIQILGSNSSPDINGSFFVTVISPTTFTIPEDVSTAGTSGSFQTLTQDFQDILACYNKIISLLNLDPGPAFENYVSLHNNTLQEAIITSINNNTKEVTLNIALDFIVGPITVYNSIPTSFTYCPHTLGDPLTYKQIFESTLMFESKAFTNATLSFASDLLPAFNDVIVPGNGNGIFGIGTGSFGSNFFGGASHAAPFRTYIPRDNQRCRFIVAKFQHSIAREKYSIFGLTLTGNLTQSTRAYR